MKRVTVSLPFSVKIHTSGARTMMSVLSPDLTNTCLRSRAEKTPSGSSTWLCLQQCTTMSAPTSEPSAWAAGQQALHSRLHRLNVSCACDGSHLTLFQRMEQDHSWETVRPGPPELSRAVGSSVLHVQGGSALPYRPLPGQRDGPESDGSKVTCCWATPWSKMDFQRVKAILCSWWFVGLEIASLDPYGTGPVWPQWFSPSRSRLAPKAAEDTLTTLGSFGEMQRSHCKFFHSCKLQYVPSV